MILLTDSKEVYWLLTLKITAGQEDLFRSISAKLVTSTEQEAGCLNYEWSVTEDGGTCHIYERYADSAAVKVHLERNDAMVGELFQTATLVALALYGAPDEELKKMFADLHPLFMVPLGGFAR